MGSEGLDRNGLADESPETRDCRGLALSAQECGMLYRVIQEFTWKPLRPAPSQFSS